MTDLLFKTILWIHIISGSAGLLIGTFVAIRKKTDKLHKKTGFAFYISMMICSLVSIVLAIMHPNSFLFGVAIFTIYQLQAGKRYIKLRSKMDIRQSDIMTSILILFYAIFFLGNFVYTLIFNHSLEIVKLVFGMIGLLFFILDFRFYHQDIFSIQQAYRSHIARITGAYIASLTAFLVVNVSYSPSWVIWLLPTAIMVPVIIRWSIPYSDKRVG